MLVIESDSNLEDVALFSKMVIPLSSKAAFRIYDIVYFADTRSCALSRVSRSRIIFTPSKRIYPFACASAKKISSLLFSAQAEILAILSGEIEYLVFWFRIRESVDSLMPVIRAKSFINRLPFAIINIDEIASMNGNLEEGGTDAHPMIFIKTTDGKYYTDYPFSSDNSRVLREVKAKTEQ